MKASTIFAILLLASTPAMAQTQQTPKWTVQVIPPQIALPTGMCMAVQLTVYDPVTKDVPRNPQGYRIAMADFDLSVNGGAAAAGHQIDPSHYEVCGCPGGAGATVSVTARYPAQSLPAAARVPGVSIQQSANLTLAPPKGPVIPPACLAVASAPTGTQTPQPASAQTGQPASPGSPASPASPASSATPAAPAASPAPPAPPSPVASAAPGVVPPASSAPGSASPAGAFTSGGGTPLASAIPQTSGAYLVTLTGVRAYQATQDDPAANAGEGDEVTARTYLRRYDRRTGDLLETNMVNSGEHGDVASWPRMQAGTRSPTGGIQDGDMIPGPALIATRSAPAPGNTFPQPLWQGALTDGVDALVISPSVWEVDFNQSTVADWQQFQISINGLLLAKQGVQDQISEKKFGVVIFGLSAVDTNGSGASTARMAVDPGMMFGGASGTSESMLTNHDDRPIGIVQIAPGATSLPNSVVVLTREIIEAALAQPALGVIPSPLSKMPLNGPTPANARIGVTASKPGIIVVTLQDQDITGTTPFPERPALYQMFIQVERVP